PKWPTPDLHRSDPSEERIFTAHCQERCMVSPRALGTPEAIADNDDQSLVNLLGRRRKLKG
ncbi:hypothetical protein J6590_056611, partial [Homalodisca vitripennis]